MTGNKSFQGGTFASGCRGFTLVEILITVALLGIVMTSLYSVFLTMQRTTYNQEEVVDVQQSLRVALDLFNRDVNMAGFVVPSGTHAVASGSDADTLNLVTASTQYRFAILGSDQDVPGGATDATFKIADPEMTDLFSVGDKVRILRAQNGAQPVNVDFTIDAINRDDGGTPPNPTITVSGFINSAIASYVAGDVIALVPGGGTDPATISWGLNGTSLEWQPDGAAAQVIATGISNLQFDYLKDNGTEADASALDENEREAIVAIRMTLTADTSDQLDGVTRQRSLATVARIRN